MYLKRGKLGTVLMEGMTTRAVEMKAKLKLGGAQDMSIVPGLAWLGLAWPSRGREGDKGARQAWEGGAVFTRGSWECRCTDEGVVRED